MAFFVYQAKDLTGRIVKGEIDAADEKTARTQLRTKKLIVQRMVVVKGGKAKSGGGPSFSFGGKVKSKDLQIFTRQFATLINSGITITEGLKILSEGMRNGTLRNAIAKINISVESGKPLAESMAQHPKVFDRFYTNMIKAGEEAGVLDTILQRLAAHIEKSVKLQGKVKSAMAYPVVIIFVAGGVVTGLLYFVVPKLQAIFENNGAKLPALTQAVVNASAFLQHKWYLIVLGLFTIYGAFKYYISTPAGHANFDKVLIGLPIMGELTRKNSIARFTRTLSTLIASGIGIIDALEIAAKTSGNYVVESVLLRAKDSIQQGKTISGPLKNETVIPSMVTQMIAVGEASGTLDVMLEKVANFYEDEVDAFVGAITSIIEPIMMAFLGVIIAVIVIAMYLPIFNMTDVIGGGAN